jgi:spore coat protein U-like protein
MKTNVTCVAVALACLATCMTAFAGDTQPLAVSAKIDGVCKFSNTTNRTLGFTIDPSSTSDAAGVMSGDITYKCTNGTAATGVVPDNGLNFSGGRRMKNGTEFLPYSLTISGGTQSGTGFGTGQDKILTVTGSVAVADFENASALTYTDSVTLTLAP